MHWSQDKHAVSYRGTKTVHFLVVVANILSNDTEKTMKYQMTIKSIIWEMVLYVPQEGAC